MITNVNLNGLVGPAWIALDDIDPVNPGPNGSNPPGANPRPQPKRAMDSLSPFDIERLHIHSKQKHFLLQAGREAAGKAWRRLRCFYTTCDDVVSGDLSSQREPNMAAKPILWRTEENLHYVLDRELGRLIGTENGLQDGEVEEWQGVKPRDAAILQWLQV
ncbi:hypothetical protein VTJ49DRAFT_5330 [Mycothermus thermophilus]|uniref:Uncharacterized protein n=1 Tax=Humicola insolens TaxID=85995 RepID=A0ABR3V4F8_HUMIN